MWDIEGKLTKTPTRAEGVPPAAINMSHLVVRWLGGEGDMVRVTKWKMRLYLPLTKIAFSFLLLLSYLVSKVTRVPIGGILFSNPVQELGITNMSLPSSILMKPYFAPAVIAFMNPVMSGCV